MTQLGYSDIYSAAERRVLGRQLLQDATDE